MAVRITTESGQIAYVAAAYLLGLPALIVAVVSLGPTWAALVSVIVVVAVVGCAARAFRGADEPVAPPRAWWRMTSRPGAGFVLAALFLGQAAYAVRTLVTGDGAQVPIGAAAVVNVAIAAMYLHSSIRLRGFIRLRGAAAGAGNSAPAAAPR